MHNYIIVGLLVFSFATTSLYHSEKKENKQLSTAITALEIQLESERNTNKQLIDSYESKLTAIENSRKAEQHVEEVFGSVDDAIRELDSRKCKPEIRTDVPVDDSQYILGSLRLMQDAACIANSCVK